jgi:hypothetical protein
MYVPGSGLLQLLISPESVFHTKEAPEAELGMASHPLPVFTLS